MKVCGRPSVVPIAASFHSISGSPDDAEKEWNAVHGETWQGCNEGHIDREMFWSEVGEVKMANGEPKYPHIFNLGTALLSAPVSNACVERLFSQMNVVKTKLRNRMQVGMTEAILRVRCTMHSMGKTCATYDIPEKMVNLMTTSVLYEGEWPEGL